MNVLQVSNILPTYHANNQALIILAFYLVKTGMSLQEIELATGMSNDTAAKAIKALVNKGILSKGRGPHGKAFYSPTTNIFLEAA
jgi:Fic family protein